MAFKRFEVQVLGRLIFIVFTCLAAVYVWQLHTYYVLLVNLIFFLAAQVYFFFRFLTRWQRDLAVFANSVKQSDYTVTYNLLDSRDAYFPLYDMLNSISAYVRKVKAESVQQNHYFQFIFENTQVGLVAYDESGLVILSNEESSRLLGIKPLKTMRQVRNVNQGLYDQLMDLPLSVSKLVVVAGPSPLKLSARLLKIVVDRKTIFLLSLVNIKSELDENELQSWQDLISVLTHEIMNSVTPINSLAGSMGKYLDRIEGNEEVVTKAKRSLDVMTRRSEALMGFVDRYRMISTVPLPRMEQIELGKLISDILTLMENELSSIEIEFETQSHVVIADPAQLEQVIINLLKNAVQALAGIENKKITISIAADHGKVQIRIEDNGKGISASVLDKIFIPFFTTREEGSGIGLTLSRQIMHRHGGTIEVISKEGCGSTFILTWPAGTAS